MPVPSHSTVVAYLALFVCRDADRVQGDQGQLDPVAGHQEPRDRADGHRQERACVAQGSAGRAGHRRRPGRTRGRRAARVRPGLRACPPTRSSWAPPGPRSRTVPSCGPRSRPLPAATADAPQAVVLGVGRFDAGNGTFGLTVAPFVSLVGQGPHTVVENRTANFQPVLALGDGAVVRDLSVVNTSTTIGARGIDGQTSEGTHVEGVAVESRTGILLRCATRRSRRRPRACATPRRSPKRRSRRWSASTSLRRQRPRPRSTSAIQRAAPQARSATRKHLAHRLLDAWRQHGRPARGRRCSSALHRRARRRLCR